jgi:hypothetical protein
LTTNARTIDSDTQELGAHLDELVTKLLEYLRN